MLEFWYCAVTVCSCIKHIFVSTIMLEGIEEVIKAGQNRLHHSIPQQRI